MALNLLTGKQAYLDRAHAIPKAFAADLGRNSLGHCGLLAGFFDLLAPQHVVVIVAGRRRYNLALPRAMFRLSLPGAVQQVIASGQPLASPALAGKTAIDGKPTAYACIGPQCSLPVTAPEALAGASAQAAGSNAVIVADPTLSRRKGLAGPHRELLTLRLPAEGRSGPLSGSCL